MKNPNTPWCVPSMISWAKTTPCVAAYMPVGHHFMEVSVGELT